MVISHKKHPLKIGNKKEAHINLCAFIYPLDKNYFIMIWGYTPLCKSFPYYSFCHKLSQHKDISPLKGAYIMNFINQQRFYKSKEWEAFRKVIIEERTNDDGFVICEWCGKPILKKYDLIVDHIEELNDLNVNNVNISLNPHNVRLMHFKCHNERHERFVKGHKATYTPIKKKVYIVYGSPCSGKSTWVKDNATPNDLIVDLDSIWEMISINARYEKPDALKSVVFETRDKLYDIIKYRSGKWHNAFVITGGALKGDRDRLSQRLGADDLIFIDTPFETCISRAHREELTEEQQEQWEGYVKQWFDTYQAD